MSIAKSKVMEVGLATKIIDRAIKQVTKCDPARTEQIVVNEFTKAVNTRKGE